MVSGVTNNLNNYVKVNVRLEDEPPKYYAVKSYNASEFRDKYRKSQQKSAFWSNFALFSATAVGVFIGMYFTRNIKQNFTRFTLNCLAGVGAGMASVFAFRQYDKDKTNKIIQQYGAREINYNI